MIHYMWVSYSAFKKYSPPFNVLFSLFLKINSESNPNFNYLVKKIIVKTNSYKITKQKGTLKTYCILFHTL